MAGFEYEAASVSDTMPEGGKPVIPTPGTVERWAWDLVSTTDLSAKLHPPEPPQVWSWAPQRWAPSVPGRPPQLVQREGRKKAVRPGSLKHLAKRADVIHTFLHHELQAAELLAWAILAFPEAPVAFRRGLLAICKDELRHVGLYEQHLQTLGVPFGTLSVNDWFWRRVPVENCTATQFVARLGVGFEGGNLDHGARFTAHFQDAGDARAAQIQAQIVEEEVAHAAFGLHWFQSFTGGCDFDTWRAMLPLPIGPSMTRGKPINREARARAGYSEAFLNSLEAWGP
jgi:uncharacterized ferritin-like protein (DUF455 family)